MPTSPASCAAAGRPTSTPRTSNPTTRARITASPGTRGAHLVRIREPPADDRTTSTMSRMFGGPMFSTTVITRLGAALVAVAATVSLSAQHAAHPRPPLGRGRRPVRSHGHPRDHRHRRCTGAPPRKDQSTWWWRQAESRTSRAWVSRRCRSANTPAGEGHQGIRRHGHGPCMPGFVDLHAHAGGSQAPEPRLRLQAVDGATA